MAKKVLVTGAGGFIGGHLVGRLLELGHEVRGMDVKPLSQWWQAHEGAINWGSFDLRNLGQAYWVAGSADHIGPIDWLFHLASDFGGIGHIYSKGVDTLRNNMRIDTNIIEAAHKSGVSRFLFSSSVCVYPMYRMMETDYAPLTEDDAYPADPNEAYGWSKLTTERLLQEYHKAYGMKVYLPRFQNAMGPMCDYDGGREKAPAALARKIAKARLEWQRTGKAQTIDVWGDGEQTRSFMYVDDCVNGIIDLIQTDHHEPVTLGPERAISINDMINILMDAANYYPSCHHIEGPEGVRGRHFDHSLCRSVLGWVPEIAPEEGLPKLYKWVEEQVGLSTG